MPRHVTAMAAAAAVVLVAGGGSYAISQVLSSGGTSVGSASGASGSLAPSQPRPATSNGAAAPFRAAGPAVSYLHHGQKATFTPVATGTDFVPGHLAAQVSTALANYRSSESASTGIAQPQATPGRVTTSQGTDGGRLDTIGGFSLTGLAACVSRVTAGDLVLLVDVATYQSAPAAVIVAAATPQGPRQVWVVGTGCSASRSDVLKQATVAAGG
jgi:hypothetical protein